MSNIVRNESDTTKSRYVTPTFTKDNGDQVSVSIDDPFPVISSDHAELHSGNVYYAYDMHGDSNRLANNGSVIIAIAFASGVYANMAWTINIGGEAEFEMYEGGAITGGTTFTAINRERNSANVSSSAIKIDPTVTSYGTQLTAEFLAGGAGGTAFGGQISSLEFVLKPLTTYIFKLTNRSGQVRMASIQLDWYE